jgi:hypothetical protein
VQRRQGQGSGAENLLSQESLKFRARLANFRRPATHRPQ